MNAGAHEVFIRLGTFLVVLVAMAAWEARAPRRVPSMPLAVHRAHNLGLVFVDTLLLRLLMPLAATGLAARAAVEGWGLLNRVALPGALELLLAVAALDLAIYFQHVLFHAVPMLWRLHRVHHADLDFDTTTGVRFHPGEILLSMLLRCAVILALGPSPLAVLVFEVVLNSAALFNHSNVRLPLALDRRLRRIVVTPDMHRVHHSVIPNETNSNFGFNLSWLDRLFGTYRAEPAAGHTAMRIGLHGCRDVRRVNRLPGMLMMPFRGGDEEYAINRRAAETGDEP